MPTAGGGDRPGDNLRTDGAVLRRVLVREMTQTCPKCGYVRKTSDTAPDWQCPNCWARYADSRVAPLSRKSMLVPTDASSQDETPWWETHPARRLLACLLGSAVLLLVAIGIGHVLIETMMLGEIDAGTRGGLPILCIEANPHLAIG